MVKVLVSKSVGANQFSTTLNLIRQKAPRETVFSSMTGPDYFTSLSCIRLSLSTEGLIASCKSYKFGEPRFIADKLWSKSAPIFQESHKSKSVMGSILSDGGGYA